jgi:hypothetical protein
LIHYRRPCLAHDLVLGICASRTTHCADNIALVDQRNAAARRNDPIKRESPEQVHANVLVVPSDGGSELVLASGPQALILEMAWTSDGRGLVANTVQRFGQSPSLDYTPGVVSSDSRHFFARLENTHISRTIAKMKTGLSFQPRGKSLILYEFLVAGGGFEPPTFGL